jgi:hypothetical protein
VKSRRVFRIGVRNKQHRILAAVLRVSQSYGIQLLAFHHKTGFLCQPWFASSCAFVCGGVAAIIDKNFLFRTRTIRDSPLDVNPNPPPTAVRTLQGPGQSIENRCSLLKWDGNGLEPQNVQRAPWVGDVNPKALGWGRQPKGIGLGTSTQRHWVGDVNPKALGWGRQPKGIGLGTSTQMPWVGDVNPKTLGWGRQPKGPGLGTSTQRHWVGDVNPKALGWGHP